MTKICLIDGSGYIFRAFYALPNMTAPNGTPVNAVYGVVMMFMRLLTKIDCDYAVVVFDAKRENFRNQIYNEYKANRAEIPELLIPQFDVIHEAVEALNLPWIALEGYEADDLIATYADMAVKNGWQAVVVSGALVGTGIRVSKPSGVVGDSLGLPVSFGVTVGCSTPKVTVGVISCGFFVGVGASVGAFVT